MSKRISKSSVAAVVVLVLLVAPVAARTTWEAYAGTETYVGALPGGREWVSEDGVYHARGPRKLYYDAVDDPRLSGDVLVTINATFKSAEPPVFVYGRMWGPVRLENDGGYWEGHWVGERTEQGYSYIKAVLHSHGDYEGLLACFEYPT